MLSIQLRRLPIRSRSPMVGAAHPRAAGTAS